MVVGYKKYPLLYSYIQNNKIMHIIYLNNSVFMRLERQIKGELAYF